MRLSCGRLKRSAGVLGCTWSAPTSIPSMPLGEGAFPSTAEILRARARQDDIDEFGLSAANAFASRSPAMAELLEGVEFRVADQVFDREITVDLGVSRCGRSGSVLLIHGAIPRICRGRWGTLFR